MELKISSQDYSILKADQPKGRAILGGMMVIIGIVICFLSLILIAFAFNWTIIVILFVVGITVSLSGIPLALKEEVLVIESGRNRIERQAMMFHLFHVSQRIWDTTFISRVEARIVTDPEGTEIVGVFFKYKSGEEEQVLTDWRSEVANNCMKYVNMMLDNKEVPEGIFRD